MATSVGNKLSAEEYQEVKKFDAFNEALNFWASSKEVIPYKLWQTVYDQGRKMYLQKDPSIQKEATLQEISQQGSAAWKAKMEELHGASGARHLPRRLLDEQRLPRPQPSHHGGRTEDSVRDSRPVFRKSRGGRTEGSVRDSRPAFRKPRGA